MTKNKNEVNKKNPVLIKKHNFDSKYLGVCVYVSKNLKSKKEYKKVKNQGKKNQSVLIVQTKKNNIIPRPQAQQLLKLTVTKKNISKKINFNLEKRFRYKEVNVLSFASILRKLMPHQPKTRFHKIAGVTQRNLIRHKIQILKKIAKRRPYVAVVAKSKKSFLAFHFAFLRKNKTLCLYELMTNNTCLGKLAGLEILMHSITKFFKKFRLIETKVYSHNHESYRLFQHLGMKIKGKINYQIFNFYE